MAELGRPASSLPSIKCSSCGQDIEILQLSDHVCVPAAAASMLRLFALRKNAAHKSLAKHEEVLNLSAIDSSAYVVGLSPQTSPLVHGFPGPHSHTTQERPLPAIPPEAEASLARRPEPAVPPKDSFLSPSSARKSFGLQRTGRAAPPRINPIIASK